MKKFFDDIKSAYKNKVLRDYFVVEYNNFRVLFTNDCGRWFLKVDNGSDDYVYCNVLAEGMKLQDSDIWNAAAVVKGMHNIIG